MRACTNDKEEARVDVRVGKENLTSPHEKLKA